MLYYNKIDKTSDLLKCRTCHSWYFFEISFAYKTVLCNKCHYIMQRSTDFNDVLTVIVKGYDYKIYFCDMCKDEAMNKMENANLNEKIGLTD